MYIYNDIFYIQKKYWAGQLMFLQRPVQTCLFCAPQPLCLCTHQFLYSLYPFVLTLRLILDQHRPGQCVASVGFLLRPDYLHLCSHQYIHVVLHSLVAASSRCFTLFLQCLPVCLPTIHIFFIVVILFHFIMYLLPLLWQ